MRCGGCMWHLIYGNLMVSKPSSHRTRTVFFPSNNSTSWTTFSWLSTQSANHFYCSRWDVVMTNWMNLVAVHRYLKLHYNFQVLWWSVVITQIWIIMLSKQKQHIKLCSSYKKENEAKRNETKRKMFTIKLAN